MMSPHMNWVRFEMYFFSLAAILVFIVVLILWYSYWGNKKTRQFVKIKKIEALDDWIEKYKEARQENEIEINQLKIKYFFTASMPIILFAIYTILLLKYKNYPINEMWSVIIGLGHIAFVICILYFWIKRYNYYGAIKRLLISSFISKVTPNTSYGTLDAFEIKQYERLFGSHINRITNWEDTIKGDNYETADVKVSSNGKSKFVYYLGNFTIIDIKKSFPHSFIYNKRGQIFNKRPLMSVDNDRFSKFFNIYTVESQEEVRAYLTDSLLDYLVDFYEQFGILFDVTFDDKIYVRFYTGDMFKVPLWSNRVDKQSVYKYYCITKFIKDIQEIMK